MFRDQEWVFNLIAENLQSILVTYVSLVSHLKPTSTATEQPDCPLQTADGSLVHLTTSWLSPVMTFPSSIVTPGKGLGSRVIYTDKSTLFIIQNNVVSSKNLPRQWLPLAYISHPGLPGVLWHSVKLRILPQDTSLMRERVEKNC
jgi:hypothetical protein